jgi:hypothetical protein
VEEELEPGALEAEAEEEPDRWERLGTRLGQIMVLPILLLLATGTVYAVVDAVTANRPEPQNPTFLDTIIASDAVVAAIRIGVIAAAAFVVISVFALIGRRQWLTGFGPVRAEESVSELNAAYQLQTVQLYEAQQIIDDLEQRLNTTTELLNSLLEGDTIDNPESEGTQ